MTQSTNRSRQLLYGTPPPYSTSIPPLSFRCGGITSISKEEQESLSAVPRCVHGTRLRRNSRIVPPLAFWDAMEGVKLFQDSADTKSSGGFAKLDRGHLLGYLLTECSAVHRTPAGPLRSRPFWAFNGGIKTVVTLTSALSTSEGRDPNYKRELGEL